MKKYAAVIFFSFLVLCLMPGFASAQFNRGNDRVCIYRDNNFSGREQCYRAGEEIADLRGFQVSSIRVDGRTRVILYEDRNFRGDTVEFSNDVRDLGRVPMSGSRRAWNDRVGSLRVVGESGRYDSRRDRRDDRSGYPPNSYPNNYPNQNPYPNQYPNNYPNSQQQGVCVFDRPNFEGRSQCWNPGTDLGDLGQMGWSDKIQSIRVFGGARVMAYRDIHFQGNRVMLEGDVANLSQNGMNKQISSLQIEGGRYGGYGRRRY